MQTSNDAVYLPRHAGLRIGVPLHVPSVTVNRLCGSGFQAVINAAQVNYFFFLSVKNKLFFSKLFVVIQMWF